MQVSEKPLSRSQPQCKHKGMDLKCCFCWYINGQANTLLPYRLCCLAKWPEILRLCCHSAGMNEFTGGSERRGHPRHDHVLCQSLSAFPQTWHKTRSTIVYSPEDVWLFPGWAGSGMHCLPALCLSHSEALQQNGNPGLWHGMAKAQTAWFLEKYLIAIIWTGIAIVIRFLILAWTTVFT